MSNLTRRGFIGAGALASMLALAGCNQGQSSPDPTKTDSTDEAPATERRTSDYTPEQQALMEGGEPLDDQQISINSSLTLGYATTDGNWDYICGGAGIYRLKPDGTDIEKIWEGDDFRVANNLCASGDKLYFLGYQGGEPMCWTVYRLDTKTLDAKGIYRFPEDTGANMTDKLAVIDGRIYLFIMHPSDSGGTIVSIAPDGSDERVLWDSALSYPVCAFAKDAIWISAGSNKEPVILKLDLATQETETLLDSGNGLSNVGSITVIDGAAYFYGNLEQSAGTFKLASGDTPRQLSANSPLGASGGFLYTHGSRGKGSLDVDYTFTRIDLASGSEEPFVYPEAYSTYNTSFEFYGLGNRLLINVGVRAYTTALDGEVIFQYTFDPEG